MSEEVIFVDEITEEEIHDSVFTIVDTNENYIDNDYDEYSARTSTTSSIAKTVPATASSCAVIGPSSAVGSSSSSVGNPPKMKAKPKNKSAGMVSFIDKVDKNEKTKLDKLCAKFFFGCNIPFAAVDSDYFKDFVKSLRPAYVPPCRQTLATKMLNEVSEEVINANCDTLPKHSTLLIDGWKNSSNNTKNVVTMLQTANGKSCFLESFDFSGSSETGEALAEVCEQSLSLAKDKYNTEIYAVVSDNAANMLKMGRLVDLWHTTCSSYTGNLLIKDIVDQRIMEDVTTVLKEFKHSLISKAPALNYRPKQGGAATAIQAIA